MIRLKKYFSKLKNVLLYFDFQPLLFFWVISDIFNNMVLWSTHSIWVEQGQGNTYFLYLAYLIMSILIMIFIHNIKKVCVLIRMYLCLYLYSTIRYLVNIDWSIGLEVIDYKNIFITIWYASMWSWIAFKIRNQNFQNELNNE